MPQIPTGAVQQAAKAAGKEAAQALDTISTSQLKALGTRLAESLGLTEARRPDITSQALTNVIEKNPELGRALKSASKNPKKQQEIIDQFGATDAFKKELGQIPRAERQGKMELPTPPTAPAETPEVPFTPPIIVSKAPRQPAPLPVTAGEPGYVPIQERASKWAGYQDELPEFRGTALEGMVEQPRVVSGPSSGAGAKYEPPAARPSNLRAAATLGGLGAGAAGVGTGLNFLSGSERFVPAREPPTQQKQIAGAPGSGKEALSFLQEPAPAVAEVPVGEEAKEEPKETPVTPPLAPEGGVPAGTAGTQAPAVDIQALKEPTKEIKKNQEALPEALTEFSTDKERLELQNKYGKTVNRSSLEKAVENLGKVDDQIKALYENNPPPQLAEVAQARREALQAYKEKATLNEWLAIADRAINAIGQFASAQAAMGTPFVGSFKPAFADYESRTAQALREYQAEAALLQEERQESEKARAEDIRLKEQAGERIRRGAEQQYRLAQEDIRAQEQAVDKADRMISDIYSANISLRKNAQDIEAAIQKYQKAQQVKDAEAQKDATQSILKLEMDRQKNAIDVSQKLLQAANELAANPNDDKALTKFLAAQGKSGETLKAEIAERPEFWTSGKIQGLASATATELEGRIKTATERSDELSTQLQSLLGGGKVSLAPAPAAKQQAPSPVQQFKESDVDAAIAAGQYPGLTKVQVLDKLKQANYSIIMGQ